MDLVLWVATPLVIAVGSAFISYWIMRSRLEVAVAREQSAHTETRERLRWTERSLDDKVALAEQTARLRSASDILGEFRIEEREFVRERRTRLLSEQTVVRQERLYYRDIPLSNWVEHERVMSCSDVASQSPTVFTLGPVHSAAPVSTNVRRIA